MNLAGETPALPGATSSSLPSCIGKLATTRRWCGRRATVFCWKIQPSATPFGRPDKRSKPKPAVTFSYPPGDLPRGWRAVDAQEGAAVWGKGQTGGNDPKPHGPDDPKKPEPCGGNGEGMAVADVHLMLVSLNIVDKPVGYIPPVGPAVKCTVTLQSARRLSAGQFHLLQLRTEVDVRLDRLYHRQSPKPLGQRESVPPGWRDARRSPASPPTPRASPHSSTIRPC